MHDPGPILDPDSATTVDVLRLAAAQLHTLGPALRLQVEHVSPEDLGEDLAEQFRKVLEGFSTATDSFAVEVDQLADAYAARPLPPAEEAAG